MDQNLQTITEKIWCCILDDFSPVPVFLSILTTARADGIDLTRLLFSKGFNLMHQTVYNNRPEFLPCFQSLEIWEELLPQRVGSSGDSFSGKTPKELANYLGRQSCIAVLENDDGYQTLKEKKQQFVDATTHKIRENSILALVMFQTADNRTILDHACLVGDEELLSKIIQAESELMVVRENVEYAFKTCVEFGHFKLLKHLKEYMEDKLDPNKIKSNGKTLIERAAMNGDIQTYKELLSLGVAEPVTVVILSAPLGRLNFLLEISDYPIWRQAVEFQDKRKKTALHFAAEKGLVDIVDLLISKGADIRKTDIRGFTALHYGAFTGYIQVISSILAKAHQSLSVLVLLDSKDHYIGAERCSLVRGMDNDRHAWHYLECDRGLIHIFKKNSEGGALDVASYGTVLRSGWDQDPPPEIVREIENQYDIYRLGSRNPLDMQPLHWAILKQHSEIALLLITKMRTVDEPDIFGLTPLHLASMRGMIEVIQALIQKGASPLVKDQKGRMPLDIARLNEQEEVVEFLGNYGPSDPQLADLMSKIRTHCDAIEDHNVVQMRQEMGNQETTKFVVHTLREVQADISEYLYDSGSGPVTSETEIEADIGAETEVGTGPGIGDEDSPGSDDWTLHSSGWSFVG